MGEFGAGVSAPVKLELRGSNNKYALLKYISRVGAWQSNPMRFLPRADILK
jgi:hypothetical protein